MSALRRVMVVDVLPPNCKIEADINPRRRKLRFRAVDDEENRSCWSGWFSLYDAPIVLAWSAFSWADGQQHPRPTNKKGAQ